MSIKIHSTLGKGGEVYAFHIQTVKVFFNKVDLF